MPAFLGGVLIFTASWVIANLALAQKSTQITVSGREPSRIALAELFKQSDTVALLRIVSGDTENYDRAVYKATVIENFKGATPAGTVYLGPYIGMRLGWEYIAFLRNEEKPLAPKAGKGSPYGPVQYATLFNEGYTAMMTSYECVFDGKEIAQQCDNGVRICTDYILLPKSTPTFPPRTEDPPFGCRLVRKAVFLELLRSVANMK